VSYLRPAILALSVLAPTLAHAADRSVHLYLQPLPSDAARLTFTIGSIVAVGNGADVPLEIVLPTVSQSVAARQRLLARGHLPSGSYAGFRITITRAALKGEHGDVTLVVPDAPVPIDVAFSAGAEQSPLVWLTLKYAESVAGGFAFTPVFAAVVPPLPIADHTGLVTSPGSNTITIFDKSLEQAAAIIDTCARPTGLALDQHRRRAYVACPRDDEIQAIDLATATVVERGRLFPGDGPRELAVTPDGTTLLSVNTGSNSVTFLDTVTLTAQERITVGSGPASLLIDAAGRRAFVFNTLSSTVSVIDITSRSLAGTISTEASPLRGQFSPTGDRLYVVQDRSPFMSVVDPRQLSLVTRARVRSGVSAIAVDHVRTLVYLAGTDDRTVEFYDPNALVPLNSMKSRAGASYLAIDVEDSRLYMVSPETKSLVVGSLASRAIVAEIDVGESPYWVAVMGEK
jgi:YVTN family beta-propeller protein